MRWLIEPSHLDLCCLQKPIIIACGSERVNNKTSVITKMKTEPQKSNSCNTSWTTSEKPRPACATMQSDWTPNWWHKEIRVPSNRSRVGSDSADVQADLNNNWAHRQRLYKTLSQGKIGTSYCWYVKIASMNTHNMHFHENELDKYPKMSLNICFIEP